MTFLHCLDCFLTRRVKQPDQAEQNEILWEVGRRETAAVPLWAVHLGAVKPSQSKHALALSGELVRSFQELLASEWHFLPAEGLLPITVLEDDLGRALDQQDLRAVRGLVERRHELVLRLERNGI